MSAIERCSDLSERAGEALAATATTAESWLLVEAPGTWPRDVSDGGDLPEQAARSAREWLARTPSSKLLFLRRPGRQRVARTLAFVVRTGETAGEIRRLELSAAEDLANADLDHDGDVTERGLVLVCGHGTRDACCALRGTAVFGALASRLGDDELWLSSHQGGHRFAANVLVLPAGIQLGRVAPEHAHHAVVRALAGRIDLPHYRGRVAYPALVQAAERVVREAEGLDAVGDLRLLDVDGERVRFRGSDGREHVAIVQRGYGPSVPASCGAEPEPQPHLSARLV